MKITMKTCSRGHTYTRSSDCPVCPKCWPGYYKEHGSRSSTQARKKEQNGGGSTINAVWHKKHKLSMPSTLAERVKWHEEHLKHCRCRKDVPPTIMAEKKKQGKKVCSHGHIYSGSGPCPIC